MTPLTTQRCLLASKALFCAVEFLMQSDMPPKLSRCLAGVPHQSHAVTTGLHSWPRQVDLDHAPLPFLCPLGVRRLIGSAAPLFPPPALPRPRPNTAADTADHNRDFGYTAGVDLCWHPGGQIVDDNGMGGTAEMWEARPTRWDNSTKTNAMTSILTCAKVYSDLAADSLGQFS
jgi:hypothetical protein